MNRPPSERRLGKWLTTTALLGILFSVAGIVMVWAVRPAIQSGLADGLALVRQTLGITSDGIKSIDSSLNDTEDNLVLIGASLSDLSVTLETVSSSLDTSAGLIGDDLRKTVIDTQVALNAAASSAEIIDDTLSFLAAIPILGANYQPNVPLHISLNQIATNMDEVPDTLETLETQLSDTASGLDAFSGDLVILSAEMAQYKTDVSGVQATLADYKLVLDDALRQIDKLQSTLSRGLTFVCIFLTGVLLWLGIAQVSVYLHGQTLAHSDQKAVNLADLTRE